MSRRLFRTLTAFLILIPIAVLSNPAQASGSRPLFQLPFACGESWRLATYYGHDDYDIDMTADRGRTSGRSILASYDGTVAFAGWGASSGWHVQLDHPGGWSTLYLHMIEPPSVITDQTVSTGQEIGRVGSTGESSGPHLHYEQLHNGAKVEAWFNGEPSGIRSDGGPYTGPIYEAGRPSRPVHLVSRNCVGRDFGGAPRADVLARNSATGDLVVYQGNGAGGFLFGSPVSGDWSRFDSIVSAWDFDRDGDNDVIARDRSTGDVHLFRGDGNGGFQSEKGKVIGKGWSRYDRIFGIRDFNGDRRPDLLARESDTGDLHLYAGTGTGKFKSDGGRVVGKDWYRFDIILSPGDFDEDGDSDIIARHRTTGDLHLFRGDGNGGFQLGTGTVISQGWSVFDTVFSVGDFTGDGLPDLIARHVTTRDLHIYPGDGVGGFGVGSGNVIGDNWAAYDLLL